MGNEQVTPPTANLTTGGQTYTFAFSIFVPCSTITLSSISAGKVGTAYSQTITASGGTAPYSFAVTAGALPTGLTLSSNGVLSGTPTTAGFYTFTVTATDKNGCIGSQSYQLAIATSAGAFQININPGAYTGLYNILGVIATMGTKTVELAPGTYRVDNGNSISGSEFSFTVDNNGIVTNVNNPAAAVASGNTLTFNNATIIINPGNYIGFYNLFSLGVSFTGQKTVVLIPGLVYRIDNGNNVGGSDFSFRIDAGGLVTDISRPAAAVASGNIVLFNNATIIINPRNYLGFYNMFSLGKTFTGQQTVILIPDLVYRIDNGGSLGGTDFSFRVDANGLVADVNPAVAMASANMLLFGNTSVTVDPGAYTGSYLLFGFVSSFTGRQTVVLIPNVVVRFEAGGQTGTFIPGLDQVTPSSLTLNISGINYTFTFSIFVPCSTIMLSSLSAGKVGTVYSQTITASGGTTPYSFVATGTLPAGLSLSSSGTLSGTPTTSGSFNFTVKVIDTNGCNGSQNYNLSIDKATPVITWSNPADIVYRTALGSTQLNATANVPGSFTYTPAAGTVLNAGNAQTLSVTFTPTDTTNYNNVVKSVQINVLKADQTITFGALANKTFGDAPFTVSAMDSSGLTVSFSILSGPATISGSTVTITGAGTVMVRASQAGNANYNPAPDVDQSFTVSKAAPVISWSDPADIVYGTALSSTQLNATANVPGTFTYSPAAGTILNAGNAQTLLVTFTPTDTANYNNATANVKINVLKANTTIQLVSNNNPTISSQLITLTATVVGPISGAATGTVTFKDGTTTLGTVNVSSDQATFSPNSLSTGTHLITAVYSGDSNLLGSTSSALSQVILPAAVINVIAAMHAVSGTGTNPGSLKVPLQLNLKVFDAAIVGPPDPKSFGATWAGRGLTSPLVAVSDPKTFSVGGGTAYLYTILVPSADPANAGIASGSYLVIGQAIVNGVAVYVGSPTDPLPTNSVTQKYLQVIQAGSGKLIPANTSAIPGSLLLIAEPAYLDFIPSQDVLPIIYESVDGDWSTTVNIMTPDGFTSDPKSISASVTTNQIEVLQFTVTTTTTTATAQSFAIAPLANNGKKVARLTHKLKHKGKEQDLNSDIEIVEKKK